METWCFLGIIFSLPHNKADVYLGAALTRRLLHYSISGMLLAVTLVANVPYFRLEVKSLCNVTNLYVT